MKKNLLYLFFLVFCVAFSNNVQAQCEVDVVWVLSTDEGNALSDVPTVFCSEGFIQLGVATLSAVDDSYNVSSNFGFFDEATVNDGFITYINIDDFELEASGGIIEITFTGVANNDCTGSISIDIAEALGITSITDYCCADPTWVNQAVSASTFSPVPFCITDTILVQFTVFGTNANTFTVTTSNGIFGATSETTMTIDYDGAEANIAVLVLAQDDLTAIDGGDVIIDIVSDIDETCIDQIVFSLDGVTQISDFCNSVLPPSNDFCEDAISLVDGTNGPFNNENSTTDGDPPAEECDDLFDSAYDATIWFSFFGSGGDVTVTAINECDGLGAVVNNDTQFGLYEGSCGGNIIACNDDVYYGGAGDPLNNLLSEITVATQIGVTYYLLVDGYNGTAGDFCLEVTGAGEPCEVESPEFEAVGETILCPDDIIELEITSDATDLNVYYMLTNFEGSEADYEILAGPQESNTFTDLPADLFVAWVVTSQGDVTDVNGTIGGLNGCFALSNESIFYEVLSATDSDCVVSTIKLENVQSMSIFPQPANNEVTVKVTTNNADAMTLDIVDLAGKVIATQNVDVRAGENNITVDISNFAAGIYFAKLANENGTATAKLIKN